MGNAIALSPIQIVEIWMRCPTSNRAASTGIQLGSALSSGLAVPVAHAAEIHVLQALTGG